jgi:hypothetical protein
MYGKLFDSAYTGSMFGAGMNVFAVWAYAIAVADRHGYVELNPRFVAAQLGGTDKEVEDAIAYLESPDPESRSNEEEGRRIVHEGAFQYRIVNYKKYTDMVDVDTRRAIWREEKRRQRSGGVSECPGHVPDILGHVPDCPGMSRNVPGMSGHVDVYIDIQEEDVNTVLQEDYTGNTCMGDMEDVQDIKETWNEKVANGITVASCRALSEKDKRMIRARIQEHGMEAVRDVLEYMASSDFFQNKWSASGKCSIRWAFGPENFVKVLNGQYNGGPKKTEKKGGGKDWADKVCAECGSYPDHESWCSKHPGEDVPY